MWLASETEEFKHMRKRIVYTSSVQRYSWNDSLTMNINLIEALNGQVDSIKWYPLQFEKVEIDLYEKKEAGREDTGHSPLRLGRHAHHGH